MENKIQQLTEQLYNEGVAKGKQESEQLVAQAEAEAAKIVENANKLAQEIIQKANEEAQSITKSSIEGVKRSSDEMIATLKMQIENLVVSKAVSDSAKASFSDDSFVKELMIEALKAWATKSDSQIEIGVASGSEQKIDEYLVATVDKVLCDKITITPSNRVKSGFTISPKGEGYYISFTGDDFAALLEESLSSKVAEILFSK